jgi:hypothetical protein
MKQIVLHEGVGRAKVSLSAESMGQDLVVRLFNSRSHVGAVALSEYHSGEKRASTSVLTRFGHKDDSVASMAAHRISSRLQKAVCVVAGIHVDRITKEEIDEIINNCRLLVERYLEAGVSHQEAGVRIKSGITKGKA